MIRDTDDLLTQLRLAGTAMEVALVELRKLVGGGRSSSGVRTRIEQLLRANGVVWLPLDLPDGQRHTVLLTLADSAAGQAVRLLRSAVLESRYRLAGDAA